MFDYVVRDKTTRASVEWSVVQHDGAEIITAVTFTAPPPDGLTPTGMWALMERAGLLPRPSDTPTIPPDTPCDTPAPATSRKPGRRGGRPRRPTTVRPRDFPLLVRRYNGDLRRVAEHLGVDVPTVNQWHNEGRRGGANLTRQRRPDDLAAVYERTGGSPTAIAKHYGVTYASAAGWVKRYRQKITAGSSTDPDPPNEPQPEPDTTEADESSRDTVRRVVAEAQARRATPEVP